MTDLFWRSIVGHERQLKILEEDIKSENISHAYLFTGPRDVGKFTVVRSLACLLQCGHDFVEECNICQQIQKGSHPDTLVYRDNKEKIKVEDIRGIIEKMNQSFGSNYHLCLIENIERMTNSAANSFLKTLEEPREKTVFVFTTNKVNRILPTILSRVRIVRFTEIARNALVDYLKRKGVNQHEIEKILEISGGKMGDVLKLTSNPEYLEKYNNLREKLLELLKEDDLVKRFQFANALLEKETSQEELILFFRVFFLIFRDFMLNFNESPSRDLRERYKNRENLISLQKKIDYYRKLIVNTNVNKRMILENLMLSV